MNGNTNIQLLRQEYKMYRGLSRQACSLDGPNSRLARFFRRLATQVAQELRIRKPVTAR
jgi:hypothetical protein